MIDYRVMPKEQLIEHCTAYSDGLHQLRNGCQDLTIQLHQARARLAQFGLDDPSIERMVAVPIVCEGLGVEL